MNVYQRKLYALMHQELQDQRALACYGNNLDQLQNWWQQLVDQQEQSQVLPNAIASSSDRVNLGAAYHTKTDTCQVKHPISGQQHQIDCFNQQEIPNLGDIATERDGKKVFWWLWRFYPEIRAKQDPNALLVPAHKILPDCPIHSYNSTVSALVGALYPEDWQPGKSHEHPYLLLFTFSPVQEFIKASRKFLDFWAGSYLLHYLSVKLCWHIAQLYGPDAVITPSLWSQEIIDALMIQEFDKPEVNSTIFRDSFKQYSLDELDPVRRFDDNKSTSLSTAGFPNIITAVVPGKEAAETLGKDLTAKLTEEWKAIAVQVREHIKQKVISWLKESQNQQKRGEILQDFSDGDYQACKACQRDLEKLQQPGCWEWNKLWDAQIESSWQPYWTAVPLGNPDQKLVISRNDQETFDSEWKDAQEAIAFSRSGQKIPTEVEEKAYHTLNVGTWWAILQATLGKSIQAVKNTRTWQIPVSPGERSTLSGQFSAVHPNLNYTKYPEGGGLSDRSMRLFWQLMAAVYPGGLFNGSEKLNALELTKRMAWQYGGVGESLGIDYKQFIRFPNLSSIAAARFAHDHPEVIGQYWQNLNKLIDQELPNFKDNFRYCTGNYPFQVPKTDNRINPNNDQGKNFNGVMFSSRWLADDMGLTQSRDVLRRLVETAHKQTGFSNGSPGDWWVIVLADGDGMGKYVSGAKLKEYKHYILTDQLDQTSQQVEGFNELLETKKRMGPATHVGLNRALLDFSNRLVPYITEKRFCGKVVYSGGDDVMAVLPLEDLPEFLRSLRAAWCGAEDPQQEFDPNGGYWYPKQPLEGLPDRAHFTMGEGATMSMGIVIAHKSLPLPTVLDNLWTAEKDRAKKLPGTRQDANPSIPPKDGLCFRVIYGSGNSLEALMKGHLLDYWWKFIQHYQDIDLSPLLYRLAEDLPKHACVTECDRLLTQAAEVILNRRDETLSDQVKNDLLDWINQWEHWAFNARKAAGENALGTQEKDLAMLLKFSAFWVDKMVQRQQWRE
ncbi:type III-B CRISPR-associated protein Cas10/Cmr2 [Moorena producens JHB]|uniref:Type III-B CRISPR-associated protein Cas10/Cmr2 n=1 Tax=Moorena producens (strain JHB) TaxID=1454205 RepID=A0A1D9FUJ8_MOOP1|nr:type III-B CRISPR-associated protein Cas10/Cmr2 [Moorena producens]AOY78995.1 type III-B CRISPR-associated protein Cas10/Cmr2 [Moorena producens JHB]